MTQSDMLRTVRMSPVWGVGQACRIIHLPGAGDVVLEGPADILDTIRLAPCGEVLGEQRPLDPAAVAAALDFVRVQLQAAYDGPELAVPPPRA
ncbi:hypothetical protein [Streptomyces sp. NPDC047315]|uniref:hypothetical protein n=1 Tax=Streptomyces sp. NPDC047315 TaxID=3155142 RepID=UPI0033C0D5A4